MADENNRPYLGEYGSPSTEEYLRIAYEISVEEIDNLSIEDLDSAIPEDKLKDTEINKRTYLKRLAYDKIVAGLRSSGGQVKASLPLYNEVLNKVATPEWVQGEQVEYYGKGTLVSNSSISTELRGLDTGAIEAQKLMKRGQDFKKWQSQSLKGLNAPQDWISKYIVEHTPAPNTDPRAWATRTPLERGIEMVMGGGKAPGEIGTSQTEKMLMAGYSQGNDLWSAVAQDLRSKGEGMPSDWTMGQQADYATQFGLEGPTPVTRMTEAEAWQVVNAQRAAESEANPSMPRLPAAEPWLAKFAPSQRVGQEIKPSGIVTPSAQQWGETSPTEQAKLMGFLDWSQQNQRSGVTTPSWSDVAWDMERMLPKPVAPKRYVTRRQ